MRAFAVTLDDTRFEAPMPKQMPLRDQVEFERHFGRSIGTLAKYQKLVDIAPEDIDPADMPPVEETAYIVWRHLLRAGEVPTDFDAFLDIVVQVGIDVTPEEESAAPLDAVQRVDC